MPIIDQSKLPKEISEKYTVENNTFLATPKFKKGNKIGFNTRFKKGHKTFVSPETYKKIGKKVSESRLKRKKILGYINSLKTRKKISDTKRGKPSNSPTKFVKGQKSWNRGKKLPQFSGENSSTWKGGITPINNKIRGSIESKLWIQSVFARDGYICQKTGIRGGRLVAHHILNFAQYPELRFAIDNGTTLSYESHRKFHKKYGIKNNTQEQLTEFLCQK